MELHQLHAIASSLSNSDNPAYREFLRVPSMSLGVYVLPAGSLDGQNPHGEDEVYYVIQGKGQVLVSGESRDVAPGSLIFVAANADHRFHSITEDLHLLVFFAPPEGSAAQA